MKINFEQLSHLQVLLQEGSISKAAQVLYTTQPALSRQLQMIEREAGITIFERSTPLKLTYAGQRYMRFVNAAMEEYHSLAADLEQLSHQETGTLTIGISRNRVEQFLPYVLPMFRKRYPGIQIMLKEDFSNMSLDRMLADHEVDMTLMTQKVCMAGIHFEPMLQEEIHLAIPPCYYPGSAQERHPLDIRDLANVPFILMKPGYRIRGISDQIFAQHQIQPPVVMETSSTMMAYKMAAEGMGATFVSTMTMAIAQVPQKPDIFSLTPEKYVWLLGCAYHENVSNLKQIHLFLDCVREALGKSPFTELSLGTQLLVL